MDSPSANTEKFQANSGESVLGIEMSSYASVPLASKESAPAASKGWFMNGCCGGWLLRIAGHCPATEQALEEAHKAPASRCCRFLTYIFNFLDCSGRNVGQVCFANNPLSGLLILAGLSCAGMPAVPISACVASTIAIIFSLIVGQPRGSIAAGLSGYNAALLGAVLPALLLGPDSLLDASAVWFSVGVGAICTVLMSSSLANTLGSLQPSLPIFTLPFNLVALISLVCIRVNQPHAQPYPSHSSPPDLDWSRVMEGGLLGAGQVFAIQDFWCSGLVLFGVFICSPLLAVAGLLGSIAGTVCAVLVNSSLYEAAYNGIYGYNSFLAACAVCFFYVPTWRSAIVGLVNAGLAAMIQVALTWAFSDISLPVLTLPFVGASLLLLAATGAEDTLPRSQPPLTIPECHRCKWVQSRRGSVTSSDTHSDP